MRPISRGVLLIAAALQLSAGPADAADVPRCNEFVKWALEDQASNVANRCNFTGRRYSSSRAELMRWCREADEGDVVSENFNRGIQIGSCEFCREIQARAEAAVRDNIKYGCGFSGDGWGGESVFAACQTAVFNASHDAGSVLISNLPAANAQDAAQRERDNAIKQCKAQYTPEQVAACDAYAMRAVTASQTAVSLMCATSGPRWSQNLEAHFRWCLATVTSPGKVRADTPPGERSELAIEETARNDRIAVCKLEANAGKPKRRVEQEMAVRKVKRLGKKKPPPPTVAGPTPGTTKDDKAFGGRSTVRQDGSSAMDRLSTSPSPSAAQRDPRTPQPPPQPGASGGISTSSNVSSGGSGASGSSGGVSRALGTNALDRGGMTIPRGLPAGSNSGTR